MQVGCKEILRHLAEASANAAALVMTRGMEMGCTWKVSLPLWPRVAARFVPEEVSQCARFRSAVAVGTVADLRRPCFYQRAVRAPTSPNRERGKVHRRAATFDRR